MTNEMPISLSPKEKKILSHLIIEGKTISQTAVSVYLSKTGVEKAINKVKEKCGVESRNQLIYFLTKNNLI